MPHDARNPHDFVDGPGNRASGEQVMENFDALWDAIDALTAPTIFQPGMISISGGVTLTGFLVCDGAAVSRATYSALFAVIGIAFGAGDGSTTFNVPDLRGRSPLGAGTGSGLTARALGTKYGSEDMKAHAHVPANGQSGFVTSNAGATQLDNGAGALVNPLGLALTSVAGTGADNLQPSTTVNFFIKT